MMHTLKESIFCLVFYEASIILFYTFSYKYLRLVASLPLLLDSVSIETIAISSQLLLLDRFDIIRTLG